MQSKRQKEIEKRHDIWKKRSAQKKTGLDSVLTVHACFAGKIIGLEIGSHGEIAYFQNHNTWLQPRDI